MAKILITGAAGYVGSTLARLLIQRNYDVHLIDNYSTPSNIKSVENIPIETADIRDNLDLSQYDTLFHLAAISGINKCSSDPVVARSVNVEGTLNLVNKFQGKIIFASSSAIYGEANAPTITEMHTTLPLALYGLTKYEAEKIIQETKNFVILRFSNIYGRGLFHKRTVTDSFIESSLSGDTLTIHGDGRQRRDFVHINDAIRAYWCAMKSPISGIFNIGGNEALSINDIAELTIKQYRNIFGYTLQKRYVAADCGRKWKDFIYSCESAKKFLGYEPSYSVSDEIRERMHASSRSVRNRK